VKVYVNMSNKDVLYKFSGSEASGFQRHLSGTCEHREMLLQSKKFLVIYKKNTKM